MWEYLLSIEESRTYRNLIRTRIYEMKDDIPNLERKAIKLHRTIETVKIFRKIHSFSKEEHKKNWILMCAKYGSNLAGEGQKIRSMYLNMIKNGKCLNLPSAYVLMKINRFIIYEQAFEDHQNQKEKAALIAHNAKRTLKSVLDDYEKNKKNPRQFFSYKQHGLKQVETSKNYKKII